MGEKKAQATRLCENPSRDTQSPALRLLIVNIFNADKNWEVLQSSHADFRLLGLPRVYPELLGRWPRYRIIRGIFRR